MVLEIIDPFQQYLAHSANCLTLNPKLQLICFHRSLKGKIVNPLLVSTNNNMIYFMNQFQRAFDYTFVFTLKDITTEIVQSSKGSTKNGDSHVKSLGLIYKFLYPSVRFEVNHQTLLGFPSSLKQRIIIFPYKMVAGQIEQYTWLIIHICGFEGFKTDLRPRIRLKKCAC